MDPLTYRFGDEDHQIPRRDNQRSKLYAAEREAFGQAFSTEEVVGMDEVERFVRRVTSSQTWAKLGPMKDVMGTLLAELEAAVHRAVRGGVDRDRIVIDPGIGFGKRGEQNSEILARLGELQRLLLPVLAAVSRKSFLAQEDPKALEYATAAAVAAAPRPDISRCATRLIGARSASLSQRSTVNP